MGEFVTLTRQGQITIPAKFRREMGIEKNTKLHTYMDGKNLIVAPAGDILKLEGILAHKAIKNKSIQEVIRLEHAGVAEAVAERYERKMKRILKSFKKDK